MLFRSGGKRSVTLNVDQPAATCWFHPHQHGKTGGQAPFLAPAAQKQKIRMIVDIPLLVSDKHMGTDGKLGRLSRFAGDLVGSSWTFASLDNASAPGQISLADMRRIMEVLDAD